MRLQKKKSHISSSEFINLFKSFSKSRMVALAKQIQLLTFKQEWKEIANDLPDVDFSDEEIMNEVKDVRD